MRRFSLLSSSGLISAAAALGACSLLNAPADVIPGGGGSGGTSVASSTTVVSSSVTTSTTASAASSSSASSTSSSGTGGAAGCKVTSDCPTLACKTSTCTQGLCQLTKLADATACDDGNFCTVGDGCLDGACTGTPRVCPDKDPCNTGACDGTAQACTTSPGNDGADCNDGNLCDGMGTCSAGNCQKGPDACAALATECTTATCMSTGCVVTNKLDDTGCGMGPCSNGVCQSGHCNITPINEGMACADSLFCTVNETCKSGFCLGMPNPCPTGSQCVQGTCDEASRACLMTPIPDFGACDDGNACTANEFCSNQVCQGGIPPVPQFTETFANNSQGWTLGPEWQIGHAKQSFGQNFGHGDPGSDVTGEGGVAGVEIGGTAMVLNPDPTHAFYYLTSPPIDTQVADSIYLTFYRWLNSDYAPYMTNTVEASPDGVNWTVVWQTAGVPITDSQWTFQSIDLTAFESTIMQIRFGFSIGEANVYTVSSWNIDYVKLQNAPCPTIN